MWDYFNPENAIKYLKQFVGVKVEDFDGDEYIKKIVKTLGKVE